MIHKEEKKRRSAMSEKWSAERRAEIVLSILKGDESVESAAASHGVPKAEISQWRDFYLVAASSHLAHLGSMEREGRRGGRTSGKRRLIAALALAALVLALGGVVYAASGDCAGSKLPFCFAPNTPAKAVEVNHNFNQVVEWIETKVGDVNDSDVTVNGTMTVGSSNGTVLTLYDDGDIAGVDMIQGHNDLRLGATAGEVDLAIDGTGDTQVYQDLNVAGSYFGSSVVDYSQAGASVINGICPGGKRVAWAVGWVNDYNTPCSANVSNSNKNVLRCAKETVRTECIGNTTCTYTGTANGCGSPGHTCLFMLCM
jgi:transposase-like protein